MIKRGSERANCGASGKPTDPFVERDPANERDCIDNEVSDD